MAGAAHGQQRRVRKVGNSWVVPVPARVRKHFRWKRGGTAYWHLTGPREAVLTPHPTRVGGKPYGDALEKDLRDARRDAERLRRKMQERPLRVFNQGRAQGWTDALRQRGPLTDSLAAIRSALEMMAAELRRLGLSPRLARRRRAPTRARPVEAVTLPDEIPSPSPAPSPESSGGDVASGGETPQATHV
jgi:hypothetical protein